MGGLRELIGILAIGLIAGLGLPGCGGSSPPPTRSPQDVASQLSENDASLRSAIDAWRAGGDPPSAPPPQEVLHRARALQSLTRDLAVDPKLANRVISLVPPPLGLELSRLSSAEHDLLRLSRGARSRQLEVGAPPPLADLIGFYHEADRRFGVGWNYLAAIHLVETEFGRVKSNSVAGAQGPMQFIPSTWAVYGHGGDIHDPHAAILAAARLLQANGAPARYAPALRAYNPSGLYVDAVSRYAQQIAQDPYAIYYLYCWRP